MRSTRGSVVLFAAGLLGAGAALAAVPQLPAEHHQGGVAFITGGIGKDEASAFRSAEKRFPLALEFVERVGKRDEFLAAAEVKVSDSRGRTVLSTSADGPFLLAKVPAGRYTVAVTHGSTTKTRHVVVDAKAGRPIVFEWKSKV